MVFLRAGKPALANSLLVVQESPFKSEAATAREYMAELAKHHLKTVRQQTRELPEQTWEGAMESLHGSANGRHSPRCRTNRR